VGARPPPIKRRVLCRKTDPSGNRHKGVTVAASQNIEITKKGFAAFDEGVVVDKLLNLCDDNVEFLVPGNSTVSGTYRGKDGGRDLFAKVVEQNFKMTVNRFLGDDDDDGVVVVLSRVSIGGESGVQADEFTYRDGKIVKVQNYGDTALFERVYGRK
jgi:uncharacterized protein